MAENSAASLSGKKRAVRLGRLTAKGASRLPIFLTHLLPGDHRNDIINSLVLFHIFFWRIRRVFMQSRSVSPYTGRFLRTFASQIDLKNVI